MGNKLRKQQQRLRLRQREWNSLRREDKENGAYKRPGSMNKKKSRSVNPIRKQKKR